MVGPRNRAGRLTAVVAAGMLRQSPRREMPCWCARSRRVSAALAAFGAMLDCTQRSAVPARRLQKRMIEADSAPITPTAAHADTTTHHVSPSSNQRYATTAKCRRPVTPQGVHAGLRLRPDEPVRYIARRSPASWPVVRSGAFGQCWACAASHERQQSQRTELRALRQPSRTLRAISTTTPAVEQSICDHTDAAAV